MKRMLTSQELAELEALLPPGQVLWGEAIGPDWTHDELSGVSGVPGAVVRAQDAAQVSAVMRFCNEREIPADSPGRGHGAGGRLRAGGRRRAAGHERHEPHSGPGRG